MQNVHQMKSSQARLNADDMQMACERCLIVGLLPTGPWHASRTKTAREWRSIGSTLGLMLRQRSGLACEHNHLFVRPIFAVRAYRIE